VRANMAEAEAVVREIEAAGGEGLAITADVADPAAVGRMATATVARFGRIDILVNNAGMGVDEGKAEDQPLSVFRRVHEVNLVGTAICCQRVGRVMLAQGEGRIINVSSIHAMTADRMDHSWAYCSSKAGVMNLTRELAHKWAPRGVHVNGIAPGLFPTEMTGWYFEDAEREAAVLESIPLKRVGTEEDIKGIVAFLATPASDYVIGHTLVIDGGQTLA